MLGAVLLVAVGAVVATVGARMATLGVAGLAERRGISPLVPGAALLGLAVEGAAAALVAAARGDGAVVAGASLGTPVALLAAGLGAGLLLAPRPVPAPAPALALVPAAALLATALATADQVVTRFEGTALVAVFAASVGVLVREGRAASAFGERRYREARAAGRLASGLGLAAGVGLAVAGALALIAGVDRIAGRTALAPGFLAAAVLGGAAGFGRSLLDVLPGLRRDPPTAVADLLASLAVTGTGALGVAALIRPLLLDTAGLSALLAAGALYAAAAVPLLARGRAGRITGAVVLALYGLWLALGSRI